MSSSRRAASEQLPEFALAPGDYGWRGEFPEGLYGLFQKKVFLQIDTRQVPDEPKILPPVSAEQAALVRLIAPHMPEILKRVEQAMVSYNDHDPDFRAYIRDPQVWVPCQRDNSESWTFVIERTDNPDFGYHTEFKGTNFIEIWAGD